MIHKNGTVAMVARHGKAFTLVEDAPATTWYTAFAASQLGGCSSGDTVEFTFQEKVSGGTTFNNIKNDVRVVKGAATGYSGPVVLGGASAPTVFGGITLSKDRSIARQNACNVASQVIAHAFYRRDFGLDEDGGELIDPAVVAARVLDIAKIIEAYTTGDLDKQEALESIEHPGEE